MARRDGVPKKTAPTTIRFRPVLLDWLKEVAGPLHPDRVSGVINDAVEAYKQAYEKTGERIMDGVLNEDGTSQDGTAQRIIDGILGDGGHDSEGTGANTPPASISRKARRVPQAGNRASRPVQDRGHTEPDHRGEDGRGR